MKKSLLLSTALTFCVGLTVAETREAPNLIIIMADDQGYNDVGFHGSTEIPTPNIDRIAAGGVTFTDGYVVYPVCGPSRAGMITGRYPQRFGFGRTPGYRPHNPNEGLPAGETTLAEALRGKGYINGLIGKWHLGAHENFHPLNRGFDEFFGHVGGGKRYFPELLKIRETKQAKNEWESYHTWITRGFEPVRTEKYLTEEFSREALEFVKRHANQPERPFFLYLAYNAPHSPFEAPEEETAKFAHLQPEQRQKYAAMISIMDRGIGQLLDLLDELGIAENTLVFFLNDNGGPIDKGVTDNSPLRAGKSSSYEGGTRVPFAARWPGVIPAGSKFRQPVSSLDIFATIASLNQIPENPERPLDGVNLIPYLLGEKEGAPHERIYLRRGDGIQFSMREGDYKIVQTRNEPLQLFNLREDIGETKDLAASEPERLAAMKEAYDAWAAQTIDPILEGMRPEEWGGRRAAPEKEN
jgi:arylsulfatase A-like enzyme